MTAALDAHASGERLAHFDLALNVVPLARARVYQARDGRSHAVTPDTSKRFAQLFREETWIQGWRTHRDLIPKDTELHMHLDIWRTCRSSTSRGDLDNMIKAIADASNGYLFHDDRQIVAITARIHASGPTITGRIILELAHAHPTTTEPSP